MLTSCNHRYGLKVLGGMGVEMVKNDDLGGLPKSSHELWFGPRVLAPAGVTATPPWGNGNWDYPHESWAPQDKSPPVWEGVL